ncbi:MAG: sigma-54-dependent Fis family transcriptional regulator [Acidobacteria bacterium]|nr:sigma-54-dependent Fis family transcriptional regulator [Acidobacteriota bacterium]
MDVLRIHAGEDLSPLAVGRPAGALVVLANFDPAVMLDAIREMHPGLPVAFYRENGPASEAVRLLRLGANEYFDALADAEAWFPAAAPPPAPAEPWRQFLIGESPAMQPVIDTIRLLGPRRSTVLIQGETGTGKEMVARALHAASPRASAPMVSVNCTALPDSLLEAELFGHTRGAFTGAMQGRVGRFEQAQRGSIFLDEIGDMPFDVQAKLLRVLQEKELQKLGSSETVKLDVRVIAATNAALERKIETGEFREDLYYRLNVVPLFLPPLRDRWQDIPLLVNHFIEKICRAENLPGKVVFAETMERLQRFTWPGNVRQLENTVERAIIMSGSRTVLYPQDFALPRTDQARKLIESTPPAIAVPENGMDLQLTVQKLERTLIEQALRRTGGNKSQAADILGMKRTTLTARLKALEAAV